MINEVYASKYKERIEEVVNNVSTSLLVLQNKKITFTLDCRYFANEHVKDVVVVKNVHIFEEKEIKYIDEFACAFDDLHFLLYSACL